MIELVFGEARVQIRAESGRVGRVHLAALHKSVHTTRWPPQVKS